MSLDISSYFALDGKIAGFLCYWLSILKQGIKKWLIYQILSNKKYILTSAMVDVDRVGNWKLKYCLTITVIYKYKNP